MKIAKFYLLPLGALIVFILASNAMAAYKICKSQTNNKEYLRCSGDCPPGDTLVSDSPDEHPNCKKSPPPQKKPVDCGKHWSDWTNVGHSSGNPCPPGCSRGREVSKEFRMNASKPQWKYEFQCWK